ncbi:MAG TPA: alpha/beta family hydrolase [Actinomycetes bacterium]|nr:alpha/beta family hydrolase [Actinomycetes bacterium]
MHVAAAARPRATLVLGHGAGGGVDTPDLRALARVLPSDGVTVVRVEQPWRVAGRKVAAPPPTLDRAWLAVVAALDVPGRLLVGGRSAGARVACRTAVAVGADGCLALAFPLHPPGRVDKSRLGELTGAGVPTLVVQGGRDPFGSADAFPETLPAGTVVRAVPHADHSFRVAKASPLTAQEALGLVVDHTRRWLREVLRREPLVQQS